MTPLAGEHPLFLSLLLFQICVEESTILNERICARVFTQMNNMKLSYKVYMVDITANEKSNTYNIRARTLGQAFLTIICRHCCLSKVAFSSASLLQSDWWDETYKSRIHHYRRACLLAQYPLSHPHLYPEVLLLFKKITVKVFSLIV